MPQIKILRYQRAVEIAHAYLDEKCQNMREVAEGFEVSLYTAHRDLTKVLPLVDSRLADEVREKIEENLEERSRRGGYATRDVRRNRKRKIS